MSYNQRKVDSHYQSVNEVSGIQVGDGGFQLAVGGNTHQVGGVIASSADPSKNVLDTGSLTYENIHNEANYSASSVGISGGYGAGGSTIGNALSGIGTALSLTTPQHGKCSSDTNAGIAQGTIIVRDGNNDLAGLDRNPTLGNQALAPIFDAQKVQENMELNQVAGYVGMRAAGDIANQMGWDEGSPQRTILHGVVGAGIAALGGGNVAQGAMGAAANQLVVQQMADYLQSQGYKPGTPEFASMLQLASTAMGAAVGGGSGAATALDGTKFNYLTHSQLAQVKKDLRDCKSQGGDVGACQGSVLANANALSQQQDVSFYLDCTSNVGCKPYQVNDATRYAAETDLPNGLSSDQVRSTQMLMEYLFSTDDGYKYYPNLDQRKDFFQAFQNGTDEKGGQTVWPQVAANTSGKLQSVNEPYCLNCAMASAWVNQVGDTIMKKEWSAFQQMYNGPILTGEAAKQWDSSMLINEQTMLQPLYDHLMVQGGWTNDVIYLGGFINTIGKNIFDVQDRINYGQSQIDSVRDSR
ncbi:hypothetical protein ISP15_18040 [Dyella jejuensis]|uniref:Filamentous hemagglutinin n=1 Tax=Dyella jejuensis TaxID=1432009 RepID=A0ABW8JM89_9GAMM